MCVCGRGRAGRQGVLGWGGVGGVNQKSTSIQNLTLTMMQRRTHWLLIKDWETLTGSFIKLGWWGWVQRGCESLQPSLSSLYSGEEKKSTISRQCEMRLRGLKRRRIQRRTESQWATRENKVKPQRTGMDRRTRCWKSSREEDPQTILKYSPQNLKIKKKKKELLPLVVFDITSGHCVYHSRSRRQKSMGVSR